MKKLVFLILLITLAGLVIVFKVYKKDNKLILPAQIPQIVKEKPLDKYTIEALSQTNFEASRIEIGELVKDTPDYSSYLFYFHPQGKKVSGLLNIPKNTGPLPVIVMFRGYIDREAYVTGAGTVRSSEVFAANGFVTLAPDFLGYGQSDNPSENPVEERFQTYTTALTLLSSLKNLNTALAGARLNTRIDDTKVGIWGHSNGGQIALTILEITGKNIPAVLWAPVSKPFPYSVLYYTDDFDDHGKLLRKVIADFEEDYDVEKYSLTNHFDKINANLQIHQGTQDDAVPVKWSDQLVEQLKKLNKNIEHFTYNGDDHNFAKGSWQTVVNRNITFFNQYLK